MYRSKNIIQSLSLLPVEEGAKMLFDFCSCFRYPDWVPYSLDFVCFVPVFQRLEGLGSNYCFEQVSSEGQKRNFAAGTTYQYIEEIWFKVLFEKYCTNIFKPLYGLQISLSFTFAQKLRHPCPSKFQISVLPFVVLDHSLIFLFINSIIVNCHFIILENDNNL